MSEQQWFRSELAAFVYLRTYSAWRPELGRRERWEETVTRVTDYFREVSKGVLTEDEIKEIHDSILHMRVMPSMRLLAMAGDAARASHVAAFNCAYTPINSIQSFSDIFFVLLNGCGAGYSVERQYTEQLPAVAHPVEATPSIHVIADSAEGWCVALRVGLDAWYAGRDVVFDYSLVRPAGTPLKTKGGRASGPEPLRQLLDFARSLVRNAAGRKLRPIEVSDLCNMVAQGVVVGGVRRCLPAGTRVHTRRGAIPIEDVMVGDDVVTDNDYKSVTRIFDQGVQEIVEINLEGNRTFRCTPNHRVAVLSDIFGGHQFKQAKDLRPDDRLLFINSSCGGVYTRLAPLPEKRPADHSGSYVRQPEMCPSTAWFMGEFFANGYVQVTDHDEFGKGGNTQCMVACNAKDEDQIRKVTHWMKDHNLHVQVIGPTSRDQSVKLRSSNRQIARWMRVYKQPHIPLTIPEEVWRGTEDVRAAFLAGVMDGDGSVGYGPPSVVSTCYESFADDIMRLLATLGIISEKHVTRKEGNEMGWQPLFTVSVRSHHAIRRCIDLLGPYLSRKITMPRSRGRGYTVPNVMARTSIPHSTYVGVWSPSLDMNSDTLEHLMGVGHYTPVKVVGVEYTGEEAHTYDIEVADGSRFVAEGLLVHNSSEISLSDLDDDEMRDAKVGAFWETHPYRSMSNNSAVYLTKPDYETFSREFDALIASGTGERGLFSRAAANSQRPQRRKQWEFGCNPCAEIILRGKQFCNLSSVVARAEDTEETLAQKIRVAAIIGTLQSTLTDFKYLDGEWKANCDEERLLGISVTGELDCPAFYQHPETMERLRDLANAVNREYAARFGINPAAATSCVKPEGTCSLVTDSSSGLHPRFSRWFLRRVRVSASDPLCKLMRDYAVPHHPEVGQTWEDANTFVFEFPCAAPEGAITRDMMTALDQLEYWKTVKLHYVEHNPSATIYVKPDEWSVVKAWVYDNFDCIGGLSFLPSSDHVYELAPYSDLTEEEYNKLRSEFPKVNWDDLSYYELEDRTTSASEVACTGGACELA